MVPFFGGQIPAKTFNTYMNAALQGTECGTFPPPGNIKGTKGTTYQKPAPKCASDQHLNGAKTRCVDDPKPTDKPSPTEPTPTGPGTDTNGSNTDGNTTDGNTTDGNGNNGAGTDGGGILGVLMLPVAGLGLGIRRRKNRD
jgi:membrane peptidoglycan carboxypeptidase